MGRSCSSKGHLLDSPLTCEWEKNHCSSLKQEKKCLLLASRMRDTD
jgi:hypothetical protein